MALFSLSSVATKGTATVYSGDVHLVASGASWAELVYDAKLQPMTGAVVLATPGLALVGTVVDAASGVFQQTGTVRIVAGAGGATAATTPRTVQGTTVETVLRVVLHDQKQAGRPVEVLADDIEPTVLSSALLPVADGFDVDRFAVPAGTFATFLDALVARMPAGTLWRLREDGRLWIGVPTWPATTFAHQLIEHDISSGKITIASETPKVRPLTTFLGQKIRDVRIAIGPSAVRQHLRYGDVGGFSDVMRAIVQRHAPDVDALKLMSGVIVCQHADDTVDIKLDLTNLYGRDLVNVPIVSIPGLRIRVLKGARCRVFWENGDRTQPRAGLLDHRGLDSIEFDNGTAAVARVGDTVDCGTLYLTIGGGGAVTAIAHSPPGGPVLVGVPVSLSGAITSGAAKVRA